MGNNPSAATEKSSSYQPISQYKSYTTKAPGQEHITRACGIPGFVEVEFYSGLKSIYPTTWLRDNCQCNNCYNHQVLGRSLLMQDLPLDPKIEKIEVIEGRRVKIDWIDGHMSEFDKDWLKQRSFDEESRKLYHGKYRLPKVIS